ncbi:hypothetical protein J2W43_005438 [Pseudomonas brassicacearum]|uniref:SMODS-associating 2TM beta-strand rich effector domain-containing protein n=1 Tax=Pseudomonas brassicacearum TaxID=930166 RepID=A0AAW8MI97_9PSED|nr:hypothetical protein [Pseudomonas brassicacearum]MDR6961425.1 hypothetical protein [Pseudomonas brassicacearum]
MGDTDTPDFNKTRGFLIGFSVVVLLLWFFGADLTRFKLLGNEVDLRENILHVWGVIALSNFYLWLRFFQRIPRRGLRFDEQMHVLLDDCLITACRFRYKSDAFKIAGLDVESDGDKLIKVKMSGYMPYRTELDQEKDRGEYGPTGPWDYEFPNRARVQFSFTKTIMSGEQVGFSHGGRGYEAKPSKTLYRATVIYTFLKGAIVHSWFTDNIWPLVIGCITTVLALFNWLQLNHFFLS